MKTKNSELPLAGNTVVVLTLLLLIGGALPSIDLFAAPDSYLRVHNTLEILSMLTALAVSIIAWLLRRTMNNYTLMLLGMGLFVVCLIDFGHVLSYQGMPDFVTPSSPEKAINFWLGGRLAAAITLLVVALVPCRQLTVTQGVLALVAGLLLTGLIYWLALFQAHMLPPTFIEGQGLTEFKVGAEYLLTAMFGVAAVMLYRRRDDNAQISFIWLAAAAWTLGLAELYFTLYTDVTDLFNLLGHLYKVAAHLMIYRAIALHWKGLPQLRP